MGVGCSRKLLVFMLCVGVLLAAALSSTNETISAAKPVSIEDLASVLSAQIRLVEEEVVSPEPDVVEPPSISTLAGVTQAAWAHNVTVTISESEFRYESNGFPNHELPNSFLAQQQRSYSPPAPATITSIDRIVPVVESPIDITITLNPVMADEVSIAPTGMIGVLVNGAQLYNDGPSFDPDSVTSYEWGFVDLCNGHPRAVDGDGAGDYHYHGVPTCTTDSVDVEGQHSSILGVLIDGFPVYGSNDVGGAAITSTDLDECSGHFGATPEFPDGIYHYHLLDEVTADPIPCLHGELPTVPTTLPLQTRNGE